MASVSTFITTSIRTSRRCSGGLAASLFALGALLLGGTPEPARASGSIALAGPDGTGFLSLSNVKAWTLEPNPETQSRYPYYFDPQDNRWVSIAAGPLSAGSTYAEEASFTVLNKTRTQADFATMSAGTLAYSTTPAAVGTDVVPVTALSFAFNGAGFSPFGSAFNTGGGFGNFGWAYLITASNLTGIGMTFIDGVLRSIDLDAAIRVVPRLGNNPALAFATPYDGRLEMRGDRYRFLMDVTQTTNSPIGLLEDTRMVFNREGSIAAVTPIPEPAMVAMLLPALAIVGAAARARRRRDAVSVGG
jgi:hypothetical protein